MPDYHTDWEAHLPDDFVGEEDVLRCYECDSLLGSAGVGCTKTECAD